MPVSSAEMIHVALIDGQTFCQMPQTGATVLVVGQRYWIAEPEQVQRATCPSCLLRLIMLADSANIALTRMGMKVETRDAPSDEELS